MHVLVTGATGYVGSRVVPRLLDDGHDVTVLTRDRTRALARPWHDRVDIVEGDVTDGKAVTAALLGVDTALYLVHGMGGAVDFAATEAKAARTFADNATLAGVGHVVYLGGLADDTDRGLAATSPRGSRPGGCWPTAVHRRPSCGPRSCSAAARRRSS